MSTASARAQRVHVRAPGKINLFFQVGDAQEDGYHDVASVYQAVSLVEDVWAEDAEGFSLSVSGSVDVSGVPTDERNLALRAARLVAATVDRPVGVHLEIVKNVPVAGGMGGGSADAAAALVACDALWNAGLGPARLHELAARLGADVPFALTGGTAVGTGRGDRLSPALATGRMEWVLVAAPGEGLSTPAVYAALDRQRARADIRPDRGAPVADRAVLQALRSGDARALAAHLHNDLQPAALESRPDLAEVLAAGERAGALAALVSGSGPTVALLSASVDEAVQLQIALTIDGWEARRAHGPVGGARVVAGRDEP